MPLPGFRPWFRAETSFPAARAGTVFLQAGAGVVFALESAARAQDAATPSGTGSISSGSVAAPVYRGSLPGNGGGASVQAFGFLVAFLLLLCAGFLLFYRGTGALGGWRMGTRGPKKLQVEETRALGQRQFLAVVEYEGKRLLLGVSPGRIDYLCPLEGGDEDTGDFERLVSEEGGVKPGKDVES
jgi:flagellar biogenesis protein FliO